MATLKDVKDAYKSVFYMKDENDGVIDVILAVTISTWTGNDGIWLLLIGGPSTGKTECLNIITSLDFVHSISTLTENTFLSGLKPKAGQEPSMLHRIGPKGVLVFKDFTTVLGLRDDRRTEILNQMREIYDGKIVKATGNGEDNKWEGKINVLAATTEVIYSEANKQAANGIRFFNYVMPKMTMDEEFNMARMSKKMINHAKEKRDSLKDITREYIMGVLESLTADLPQIPEYFSEEIRQLAYVITKARAATDHNWKGDVEFVHEKESITRLVNQMEILAQTFMLMNHGNITDKHKGIIFKILMDSIPKYSRRVMEILLQYPAATSAGVAQAMNMQTDVVARWLIQLNAHEIVDRKKNMGTSVDMWNIRPEIKKIMKNYVTINESNEYLTGQGGGEAVAKRGGAFDTYGFDPSVEVPDKQEMKEKEQKQKERNDEIFDILMGGAEMEIKEPVEEIPF